MSEVSSPPLVIAQKRDGAALDEAQISAFVTGITKRHWSDAQVAALAMAMTLNGLSLQETSLLTRAMVNSGEVLSWPNNVPVVDKHATGGVGDTTSLVLAPLLAACGFRVPMISGRGLAHTGGTLDKLEAIPGFDVHVSPERLREMVLDHGCAIVAQSERLAPADRRLYAIRDVTGTVPCQGLITGSILCKKIAAGLHGLLLDIKVGEGSFVADLEQARQLADTMRLVAKQAGLPLWPVFSDMSTPLAEHIGHSLEVRAAIEVLSDPQAQPRLRQLVLHLAERLLKSHQLPVSEAATRLADGTAAMMFCKMVAAQGGPATLEAIQAALPQAKHQRPVLAHGNGRLARWRAHAVADVLRLLGGARGQADQALDLSVGISRMLAPDTLFSRGEPLATLHANDERLLDEAEAVLRNAMLVADDVSAPSLIL
jgi:thymidine phosphorylase